MYTSKLSRTIAAPVALLAGILSQSALSITFQGKPDIPVNAAEFGHTLAKHGKYIIVGADRHAEFGRNNQYTGNWDTNRNVDGGAIYLLTDDNSEPIRKYQFLKDPTVDPTDVTHAEYLANPFNFSSQVDITDNWIIATLTRHYNLTNFTYQPAVVIIPKTNGQFPTCPTSAYVTGITGNAATQTNWGNAVNCTPIASTSPSSSIVIVPLPAEFIGKLGRNVKVKISGNAFVVSSPERAATYHRNAQSGQWQLINTFLPETGNYISDIALHGQNLVISEVPNKRFISYVSDNAVIEDHDFVYAGSGKVHTFKVSPTALTTAGTYTGALGFGYRVEVNNNLLVVSSGGFDYPDEFITLYPYMANMPLATGRVYQYVIDPLAASGQNAWQFRGYGEFTSTPVQLSLDDNNVLAVQLLEVGRQLNTNYIPYEPNTIANIFYGDLTQGSPFNLGSWAPRDSIYQSHIASAKPYYSQNDFYAIDPIQVGNGNVVVGWRGAKGDNSNLYPLNGAYFQINLSEL